MFITARAGGSAFRGPAAAGAGIVFPPEAENFPAANRAARCACGSLLADWRSRLQPERARVPIRAWFRALAQAGGHGLFSSPGVGSKLKSIEPIVINRPLT